MLHCPRTHCRGWRRCVARPAWRQRLARLHGVMRVGVPALAGPSPAKAGTPTGGVGQAFLPASADRNVCPTVGGRVLVVGERLPVLAGSERFWGKLVLAPLGYAP